MKLFGLNSPEIFLITVIILSFLGTKRIEKGYLLFQNLLKFLLSTDNDINSKKAKEEEERRAEEERQQKEKIPRSHTRGPFVTHKTRFNARTPEIICRQDRRVSFVELLDCLFVN